MVSVATGGARIENVQDEFAQGFDSVVKELANRGFDNPLPYRDLWQWYGRWSSDGALKTYQSRRSFVAAIFDPLVKTIQRPVANQSGGDSNKMAWPSKSVMAALGPNLPQLNVAIERLQRRIAEVEALDPTTLEKWSPNVDALQASIDDALSRIFGHDTVEYKRYRRTVNWAAEIPTFGGETSLQEYRDDVAKGKREVLTMLGQAVRSLQEELADHANADINSGTPHRSALGNNIVIGHGGSPLWRELKDFLRERLHLPVDEFNNVSVAGIPTAERLTKMLDDAAFAFLVMTAEDQQPDGTLRARENVVHEIGLFQGRLGFKRAIVLLEEGCEEFSNIRGLGQIRFPKGKISAEFEKIRIVLEREGVRAR